MHSMPGHGLVIGHFIVQGTVVFELARTFRHPCCVLIASMLYTLSVYHKCGFLFTPGEERGEEEIENPDHRSSLIQTLPRRDFLFMQTKPCSTSHVARYWSSFHSDHSYQ